MFELKLPLFHGFKPVFGSIYEETVEDFLNLYKMILGASYIYFPLCDRHYMYEGENLIILYIDITLYDEIEDIIHYMNKLVDSVRDGAVSGHFRSLQPSLN